MIRISFPYQSYLRRSGGKKKRFLGFLMFRIPAASAQWIGRRQYLLQLFLVARLFREVMVFNALTSSG